MTSDLQIAANQRNALSSTGPRTEEGKNASSQNALKHGLTARKTIVLEDEDEGEFEVLKQSLDSHFMPSDPMAQILVETLAACLWRLKRIPKFESLLLQAEVPVVDADTALKENGDVEPIARQLEILRDFVLPKDVLGKISRYEGHLWREVHKILQVLGPAPMKRGGFGATQARLNDGTALAKQRDDTHDAILRGMSEPRGIYR